MPRFAQGFARRVPIPLDRALGDKHTIQLAILTSRKAADMKTKPLRVAIIGAGTGGLCLAHGLHRQGMEVNVFERDRTRVDGPPGYRIGIDGIGMKALRECLPENVMNFFDAACARTPRHLNSIT